MTVYVGRSNFWSDLFTFHKHFLQNFTAQPLVIQIFQQLISCKNYKIGADTVNLLTSPTYTYIETIN